MKQLQPPVLAFHTLLIATQKPECRHECLVLDSLLGHLAQGQEASHECMEEAEE